MTRFLVIAADGETIAGLLSMDEDDALLNVESGQTLLAMDPETDNGTVFLHESVTVDLTGPAPVFLDAVTGEPPEHDGLVELVLDVVA